MLENISSYHLVIELLHDGRGGILPDLEPIAIDEIITELQKRSKLKSHSDKNSVIAWFLSEESKASEQEKGSIRTIKKIKDLEDDSLGKIGNNEQD